MCTRRWLPAVPNTSTLTPAGNADGVVDSLYGPRLAQSTGRGGIPAVAHRRRRAAPRQRRRRCGGALFAVRRTTATRGGAERPSGRGRDRELRRVVVVLPARGR